MREKEAEKSTAAFYEYFICAANVARCSCRCIFRCRGNGLATCSTRVASAGATCNRAPNNLSFFAIRGGVAVGGDDQCLELWWGFMLDTVAMWQIVPDSPGRQMDEWMDGRMDGFIATISPRVDGASSVTRTAASPGQCHPKPAPYDLLSVNKELKSVGLHCAFSLSVLVLLFGPLFVWPFGSHSARFDPRLTPHTGWPSGFPYQCVPYSRRADFISRSRQFRNKISPACKLKLQCNWLIHAYIMAIVAGAIQICRGSAPGSFIPFRLRVQSEPLLRCSGVPFHCFWLIFLWITFFIKFFRRGAGSGGHTIRGRCYFKFSTEAGLV